MNDTQYNNAFYNNSNKDLDQMARNINNKRKKIIKDVAKDYDRDENEMAVGLANLQNLENAKFMPHSYNPNCGFFSTQGDYSDRNPAGISKYPTDLNSVDSLNSTDEISTFSSNESKFDSESIMTPISFYNKEYSDNSSIFSDTSSLTPKIKKHLKLNTSHLKNIENTSDDKILDHINNCEQCKNQVFMLLKKENNYDTNHLFGKEHYNDSVKKQTYDGIFKSPETKDIIILILIGVFIIVFLDMFIKR